MTLSVILFYRVSALIFYFVGAKMAFSASANRVQPVKLATT